MIPKSCAHSFLYPFDDQRQSPRASAFWSLVSALWSLLSALWSMVNAGPERDFCAQPKDFARHRR